MASIRRLSRALLVASCVTAMLAAAPAEARTDPGGRPGDGPAASSSSEEPDRAASMSEARATSRDRGRPAHPHGGPPGRSTAAPGRTPTVAEPGPQTPRPGEPESPPGTVPPPWAGPTALPVPPPDPARPAGASDGPVVTLLEVPEPVVEPEPAPAPPPDEPAPVPESASLASEVQAPAPADPVLADDDVAPPAARAAVPTVTLPPGLAFGLAEELGDLAHDVGQTLERVMPRSLGPIREPLAELVPILLALLGAFLALQRGIGHGLGHVPMVATVAPRHTVSRD